MATKKKTKKSSHKTQPVKRRDYKKWVFGITSFLLALILAVYIGFQTSPWPGALIIRYAFDKGGSKTSHSLEKHVPSGIATITNEHYRADDKDAYLDVYYPETVRATTEPLPTIIWVHGGAWISGSKENVANYLKILSSYGYTTVGINYSIAPEKHYPTPVIQINDSLNYIQANAERLHINPYTLVLAGDSAGSQIASQLAAIITNPSYAQQMDILPALQPSQLKAMVLNCGAYDLALTNQNGEAGDFLKTVLWAYSGKKDFQNDPKLKQASVIDFVTTNFPPTFITAGNADPLEQQSLAFAKKLTSLKVSTDQLFYSEKHEPKLPHEYQFNLDNADGKQALSRIVRFLNEHTR
jgi:acetyl esterase